MSWRHRAQGVLLDRGPDDAPPGRLPTRCKTCGRSFDLRVHSLKAANLHKVAMALVALIGLAGAVASGFWLVAAVRAADAAEDDSGAGIVIVALLCVVLGLIVLIASATAASNYLGINGKGVAAVTIGKHSLGPISPMPPDASQQPGDTAPQRG